jgi:hypothetical protein
MLNVMWSVITLNVMLSVIMLNVMWSVNMLSVVMLNVIWLSVVAQYLNHDTYFSP